MKVNTHKRRREARRREITERMKGVCACMKREREREESGVNGMLGGPSHEVVVLRLLTVGLALGPK